MSDNVITFPEPARLSAKRLDQVSAIVASVHRVPTEPIWRERPLAAPLTETCKNQRLRDARRDVWRHASALTSYWRARLDWHTALSTAQSYNVADSHKFPPGDGEDRFALVDLWRTALVKQMLTPAPDAGAVAWKRAQLRAKNYRYTDVKPERIERAIADDVAFLEAHPTRRSIAASRQSSKPEPA